MKYNKGFAPILVIAIIVGALVVVGGAYYAGKSSKTIPQNTVENNYYPPVSQNPITNNQQVKETSKTTTQNNDCNSTLASASTHPSFVVTFPTSNTVLSRGSSYNITWTGKANCYDIGFFLDNPKAETPYNFIGKAYQEVTPGVFTWNWTIPSNIQPGAYKIQFSGLAKEPLKENMTNSATFTIK